MLGQSSKEQFSLTLLEQIVCKSRTTTVLIHNVFYAETSYINWSVFTLLVNLFSLVTKWTELISQFWWLLLNLLCKVWDYLGKY